MGKRWELEVLVDVNNNDNDDDDDDDDDDEEEEEEEEEEDEEGNVECRRRNSDLTKLVPAEKPHR